jgi:hypothetical protein
MVGGLKLICQSYFSTAAMNLSVLPHVICRVPAFSTLDRLEDFFDELKLLIKDSSPEFHERIKNTTQSNVHELDEDTMFTVFKYFNRAKFRSTPFAKFASVSLVPISQNKYLKGPIVLGGPNYHILTDWREIYNAGDKPVLFLKKANYMEANSTVYNDGSRIKYFYFNEVIFELSSVH